jgi:hypothetical protein
MRGINGTVFAYGQTGTGKTYSMIGDSSTEDKKGIIPRALQDVFEEINNDR